MKTLLFCLCYVQISLAQTNSLQLKDSAVVFGANVISTGDLELHPSFTSDGQRVFFSKASLNFDYSTLFYSDWKKGQWTHPKQLPFCDIYRYTDPVVSTNNKKLFFMSDRPIDKNDFKDFDYHLYYVNLDGNSFSQPVSFILPLDSGMKAYYLSFAENGNIYFFSRLNGLSKIYRCVLKNGEYQKPEKISFCEDKYNDIDPIVAKDESFIIFSSANRPGLGDNDLWISYNSAHGWGEPINLGNKINSPAKETAPELSPNQKILYFTSYREKINRFELIKKNKRINPGQILNSYQNGNRNIYQINIEEILSNRN